LTVETTIIAPATAPGRGGISVIRISGPSSRVVVEKMCGPLGTPWQFRRCDIRNKNKRIIDSGLVVFFEAPHSYTGEDVVELHCHGNPNLVDLVLVEGLSLGLKLAEPGEFTKRAFLNNKIDLAQAESVADLIAAQTEEAILAANNSLSGRFSEGINKSIASLVSCRVSVEASLDFPEEVPEGGVAEGLLLEVEAQISYLGSVLEAAKQGLKIREGFGVAVVGAPNAGKSTLVNRLAQDDLVITSDVPGTTRDSIRANINLSGVVVEFVDTAGMRKNPVSQIEREGIKRTQKAIEGATLVLHVVDANKRGGVDSINKNSIKVLNKCDLLDSIPLCEDGEVCVSAATGFGFDNLIELVLIRLGLSSSAETSLLSRRRHVDSLESALFFLNESASSLKKEEGMELVAENLLAAQKELGEITNPVSSDDLLGEIFSEFCLGK